jgi:hypothetical protein
MLNNSSIIRGWRRAACVGLLLASMAGRLDAQPTPKPADDPLLRQLNEMMNKEERERKAGGAPKHPNLPPQDPCAVVPAAQIKRLLPAAQAGQRDTSSEQEGVARCIWRNANGLVQLKLELRAARADDGDRLPSPLPPGGAVRRPSAAGEGAIVFFLPSDPKLGLPRNLAAGQARHGKIKVSIESDELALQGAQPAVNTLEALLQGVRL